MNTNFKPDVWLFTCEICKSKIFFVPEFKDKYGEEQIEAISIPRQFGQCPGCKKETNYLPRHILSHSEVIGLFNEMIRCK